MDDYDSAIEKARQELTADDVCALKNLRLIQSNGGSMLDLTVFFDGFSDKGIAALARESQRALESRIKARFG
jgi:hypothetical protein